MNIILGYNFQLRHMTLLKHKCLKNTFIVLTDAHYYKINRNVKTIYKFKIITLAATCVGSRRNHHQGTVLCLAQTTKRFFCARQYRRSQCYGGISACCAAITLATSILTSTEKPYYVVLAKHRAAPSWWFLREPKHVGASVIILNCFNILWFL